MKRHNTLKDKNVVLIGGGTGSSVFLRKLKNYTQNITAIVNVCDDGGSTGTIRKDYSVIAMGDIRNCIVALSDEESVMSRVINYRFKDGFMSKQSVGNIIITALDDIMGSFPLAISAICDVLAITGKVLPVSTDNITLCATMKNGKTVKGESEIPKYAAKHKTAIEKVYNNPENATVFSECVEAIKNADVIIYAPGSLYTSIIPNFLVEGMTQALKESKAEKFWIMNLMTQKGETQHFRMSDHIKAFEKHSGGEKLADVIIYSTSSVDDATRTRYKLQGAAPVEADVQDKHCEKYEMVGLDLAEVVDGAVRHNSSVAIDYICRRLYDQGR
ncbi:MAG: YvcK family protein [Anaerofustis stercorihominis]|nr:YvcK family protein [Anaerofustis stercorihominis]